ncbi:hypothetical protein BJX63DRAFT_420953 [Aspergillus granulosus]|uniref:Stress-response A/B barrel domain-containing protein n=1 Tax=Aspergillus granulosus TaxID=176169 RepID=A0ABR4HFC1_9EURO
MSISHIVLFQLKRDIALETIHAACKRMLSLKDRCLHPYSQKPYIIRSVCGIDNSIEGSHNDPMHQDFVRSLDGLVEKAQVVDFTDRVL